MSRRKFYRKPKIKQVELKPEEAVLTGCKTDSPQNWGAGSDAQGNCKYKGSVTCSIAGS